MSLSMWSCFCVLFLTHFLRVSFCYFEAGIETSVLSSSSQSCLLDQFTTKCLPWRAVEGKSPQDTTGYSCSGRRKQLRLLDTWIFHFFFSKFHWLWVIVCTCNPSTQEWGRRVRSPSNLRLPFLQSDFWPIRAVYHSCLTFKFFYICCYSETLTVFTNFF